MTGNPLQKFSDDDRDDAKRCADEHMANARRIGAKSRFDESTSHAGHYLGALGELAFARFMGVPWQCNAADGIGQPDVAGYEVRAIGPGVKYPSVKAKANDPDDRRIAGVLLLANLGAAMVAGWLYAAEIRRLGTLRDPGGRGAPAYFLDGVQRLRRDDWS